MISFIFEILNAQKQGVQEWLEVVRVRGWRDVGQGYKSGVTKQMNSGKLMYSMAITVHLNVQQT